MALSGRGRKSKVYRLKKSASEALIYVLSVILVFLFILGATLIFILVQWKNVEISDLLSANARIKAEILKLNSENSRLEIQRNEWLNQVPERARKELGLEASMKNQMALEVDIKVLKQYEAKDQNISE